MATLVDSPAPASPCLPDDSSTASSSNSKDRRPSLSISTAPPPNDVSQPQQPQAAHQVRSSPSTERPPTSGGGSSAGAGAGGIRSFSHTRSQSMSEHHHHNSPTSPPSAGGEGSSAGASGGAAGELVRRHHTLSTSSSRMGRLERSRARLALQGVGLSEEDQDFYIPPSPVRAGPVGGWSDVGHGAPSFGAPPTRHSLAVVGESHSRTTSNSSAWGGSSEAASSSSPSVGVGAGASPQGEQQEQDQQQPTQVLPAPAAKRSSFVVLRGAKGDAALTQRRTEQPQQQLPTTVASPPRVDSLAQRTSSPPKELKHKNSLKPFLEAEASSAGGEEEWERSLKDERDKEEMELSTRASLTLPLLSALPTRHKDIRPSATLALPPTSKPDPRSTPGTPETTRTRQPPFADTRASTRSALRPPPAASRFRRLPTMEDGALTRVSPATRSCSAPSRSARSALVVRARAPVPLLSPSATHTPRSVTPTRSTLTFPVTTTRAFTTPTRSARVIAARSAP
ncbi:hypothetical protein BCR35DRAFT_222207 [Leucosporidium creatinivorum]|uniref:Uncharacterized protein n=1 Tax=Leucosporidium creatinivorum TaxID=106004 RepID=A0A1Y2D9I9_9BASI|nr:hypothetical protein BCR35DRAFT_222207 [Leucosporidium creatinivorum]